MNVLLPQLSSLFPTIHIFSLWVRPKPLGFHKNLIFFYYFFLKEFSFWCLLFFPFPLFIMLFISWKLVGYVFMWHLSALCSHVLYVNWEVCVKFWFLIIVFFVLVSSEVCGLVLEISFVKWGIGYNGYWYQFGDYCYWVWFECNFHCFCLRKNNLWKTTRAITDYIWNWTNNRYRTGN